MNALAKIDAMKPWVSESVWNDLLDVRYELESAHRVVANLAVALVDSQRPHGLPLANLNPVSQKDSGE